MGEILMIHKEDIKRVNEKDFDELRKESPKGWWSEKNATHKNTRKKPRLTQKYASHSSRWTDRPFDFVSRTGPVPHRQSHESSEGHRCGDMGVVGFGRGFAYKRSKDNKRYDMEMIDYSVILSFFLMGWSLVKWIDTPNN